ncbi:transcription termination factor Rho [Kibdelosporangium banguiense]|uniref:Transcription termination factor Rho n=1 Tax=Kibdelosporangium banguiense TaxID=1365924 RepID=A0ABS4TFH8_9PSEU|nr:transcription termination factor Rho [Kibdelosporangium banguiense]MBP2323172.1 transcription termination factor Rho [Kibdelosporangium banguiense]
MSNTDLLSSDTAAGTPDKSQVAGSNGGAPRRRAGLSGMVLAELRELAGTLGITGTTGMRKGDLIAAIKERQGGSGGGGTADTLPLDNLPAAKPPRSAAKEPKRAIEKPAAAEEKADKAGADEEQAPSRPRRRRAGRPAGSPEAVPSAPSAPSSEAKQDKPAEVKAEPKAETPAEPKAEPQAAREDRPERGERQGRDRRNERGDRNERGGDRNNRGDRDRDRGQGRQQDQNQNNAPDDDDDDERGGRRGRRFRDRRRRGGRAEGEGRSGGGGTDTEVREDDVLLPVAGVLDVLENYAFVRTSGYLAGPNDVYVSLSLVRRYGLRRGDAITGLVRQPREGEQQRQKFNPLVRVETVNGMDPDQAKARPEFTKLTPLYPNERLRLETEPHILSTRVIDLVMPVGKGQRALIVSPPKAGKTTVLQQIANAIAKNNPECYLMVVLVDERPEEVTDMQRNVDGEVIAATFDRPPSDHTMLAELAIERAKRLVEMGTDVVVLLDSVTRLGRAYNLAAPASGRILSGGVDSTALYPPKRFLGAARNIENGGSLTIFATALVETGSAGDSVIFEEFKGTGNAELKLDRKIADKRTFPAVDVDQSSTRKEDLLLSPDELAVTHKLRRVLHALEPQAAIELLLDRLRKTRTNIEFLMQVAKTTPGAGDD